MSKLADRLRGIMSGVATPPRAADPAGPSTSPSRVAEHEAAIAEVLDGAWHDTEIGPVLCVERTYRPGYRHGRATLADYTVPDDAEWRRVLMGPRQSSSEAARDGARTLFVDLETTGLAGGAGTYAFLVGCGWFEGCTFRVRQFFMSAVRTEPALLAALRMLADTADLLVTFNGKTFDLPLIENRYVFHRLETPFAGLPHLDMLHPARRLWRADADDEGGPGGCRLTTLERVLFAHQREGDVPGMEIPGRFFHYVRTGDARPLAGVFEHNRLDLLSLALVTARAAQLIEDGVPSLRTAREAVGLGALYERAGDVIRARQCYARAAGLDEAPPLPGDVATIADALHGYAALCRRARQHAAAAAAWRRLLELRDCPRALVREATEALAIHHEHRLRDPRTARAFALQSAPHQSTAARRLALQHRLARLESKLVPQPAPLF